MQINNQFQAIDQATMTENLKKLESVETRIPTITQNTIVETNSTTNVTDDIVNKFINPGVK